MEELDEFGIPIKKTAKPSSAVDEFGIPIKKKDSSTATATVTKSDSEPQNGSSDGKGFPKIDTNSVAPGLGVQPKVSVPKKTFRLPTVDDEAEMQRRGITPPPSEMLKQTANNTNDIYNLDANGNVISEKPNKLFAGLKKQDKTKGFYQQGAELVNQNKDIHNGFSEKTTFELEGGKLIPKTTVKDFKTNEGIDKEIENNDLNLDHPYLYYSTFDKENQPKDTFLESNFGENKLLDLGINTADFDGFLNKKGYKAEFLDKEANGLFEGKGADLTGGYNIQLAKEIQKQRLLNLYMQDINSRDFAKRKLNQEKVNLGKLGADREQLNTQYTLFDSNKVGAFYEKEMPILTQKLKERDAENLKIYEQHKKGDAGFFYGTKQVLNSGWNGFLDRVNQTSSTMLDKIGLDSGADELRLLNEERQIQRPNTRDVGYASGRTTTYDGVKYLVTNDGQIIDQDKKIRVTDLFFKPTYDAIVNKSKLGEEDSVFSFQGSAIQAGGVLGDMIVQVALQRGVGLASGATVKAGSLLSKIPISKSIGSAIIAQSALGYSQGLEQTYKAAIDAGIDEKTAKVLATDAAQRMAGLYAVTAPISPQTKAIEGIFGSEGKELIKKAIAAYTQTGKKGFIETFKQGGKQLSKNAIIFTEEGGKEVFQENIQQGGESYGVNASINREAGRELLKETISGDEFVNTNILSFASGGLMTLPGIFSSTDKLKTLQQLSKDPIAFEKNLKELVSKGVFTNDKADVLRKDVKIYSNQSHKIPKNLNKDIAMDVMSDLEDISQLEVKKKGIDKSFHEEIDAEIEAKRTGIRDRINFVGLSKTEISTLKETASDELVSEAKEQGKKEFKFDNKQITERANIIYAKQVKEAKKKENEQTPTNSEAQPQAEVPQQAEAEKVAEFPLLEGETLIDKKADSKGNIHTTVALTTEKDGRKKTKFLFNRSDKDAGQRNMTSISPEKLSSDFGFEISKDDVPEGFEVTRVKEIRETDKGSGATVTIKNIENNESWDADIVITKSKPQEVSPVEDVVAPSVAKEPKIVVHATADASGFSLSHSEGIDAKDIVAPQDGRSHLDTESQIEINKGNSVITKNDINKSGEKEILINAPMTDSFGRSGGATYEFTIDKSSNATAEGIKEIVQQAHKFSDNKGKELINETVKAVKEYLKQNEATPPTNTPTNGNVPLGASNVGESGNAKPKSNSKSSVPSSVDGGEVKGETKIEKNSTFIPKKETIKDDKGNPITFYHGTESEFSDFDESKLGSFTGADSAKEGFFFTNNKNVANSYRQQSIYDKPNTEGLKAILSNMSKEEIAEIGQKLLNNDAKYYYGDMTKKERIDDILVDVIKDTESESYYPDRNKYIEKVAKILKEKGVELKPYLDNGQVIETHLDIKNPKIIDAKGDIASDFGLTKILKDAKAKGHDGVIIKNIYDSVSFEEKGNDTELSDIVVVFDKKQINIKNKPAETTQPKSVKGEVEVEKKSVTLPSLDDIADFINQTYLKDEQPKPTTESNSGAKKRSSEKNIDSPESAGKSKTKEVVLDENGYVIVSKKGKTPLEKRKFKGDRKEAVSITPSDARSVVLSFFAKGGKIASSYFTKPGELKARNNGINGIATTKAKDIDSIAHDLWQSQENKVLKLDTEAYKGAIEEVVRSHNNIQDVVDSLLKYGEKEIQESPKERQENFQAYNELQAEEKASDEEMQKALNVLDQLSEAEIIELTNDKEKGFEDYLKDLEERQVTYDLGPFSERGTLQADGSIISENGDYVSKESVTNVKQVNPKIQAKKEISKDSPELKEVNAKLVKANEKLRIAKDALDRKAKSLDKELLKDNEDIFGERKNQNENKLFDERVDGNARNKATEKERKAITDAQNEIKSLKEAKAKIENGEIVSTKEMVFAEVDRIAQQVKDLLPGIKDPDLKVQGFSQDQLIDLIATAVKKLISAGIDVNEAITQVVDSIKAKFGDIDIDIDAVKEKINPKVEEEKKSEPKKSKSKESSKDMEDFRDSWNKDPNPSGEINQYDSGNTIKREHGELRNNQDYEVQKDLSRVQIGIKAIEHAKRLFGAEYVEKTLSFIEQANLSPEKKAVAYVLLENEMDARAKDFPDNVGVKKLQDLVRAKSQAFLANSARAIGAGRFRVERFRELVKNGFAEEEYTNAILSTKQIKDKERIQQLSQVTSEDVDNESDLQESDVDFEIAEPTVKRNKKAVKKDISDVLAQMRKDLLKVAKGNVAMSSIPYAAQLKAVTPHILKLSKLLAELGGMKTKEIIAEIHNNIKEMFPEIDKNDVSDILKEQAKKKQKPKTDAEKKTDSVKEVVKQALIASGFGKEITVTKNQKDAKGNNVLGDDGKVIRIKEQKQVLDWKKIAGEAGTIENIRKNVEASLPDSKYTKAQKKTMQDALEAEYVRLSADVIQKGLDELVRRNTPRKPVNTKTAARKLAELHNYGLFEKNKDSYEKIINNVLGFNELDQKAFDEMKQIAKGYAVLMDSGLSETEMKDAINTLSRRQSRLVATLAFSQADWKFKLAVALSEITNLSTRFKLVNLGNLAENISSGMMARAANNMMDAIANGINGKKTSNKAIITQSKINARAKLKGITLETAESYGDTSSLLLNHSAVEDYFNNSTANKAWHAVISTYMAKPVLEGADSYNKILITEAKMVRATIKVLEAKGMSNSEALDYVAKSITGESMKEALVKAKELIEKVNEDAGRKLLNDSESSIKSLAADIVKESLVSGGQLTETELKAIYNAAYKSAGKDIGHVSNNWVTDQISSKGAQVEKQVADAIKEKNWGVASGAVVNQIIWKNFISTFVGGGTNWFVKGLQKSANPLSLISLRDDMMKLKMAGKLDVTTDEGIKNMEESLYRGMNLRSTSATMLMGAIITASIIGGMSASGADDEIAKWLKKNQWAKKFFDKMVPDAVVLMLAINDNDFGRYIAKMVNVKADFFDDQKNTYKILEKYAKGYVENDQVKISKASGDLGAMIGKRFELPAPLRAAKDIKQIYKGVVKGEYDETNYYTSGFLNGLFQGGIIEMWGLRKDPDFQEQTKGAFSTPKIKLPSLKFNANPQ